MNGVFDVEITALAQKQISEIASYIANELSMPIAANHFLNKMEQRVDSLAHMPERAPLIEEEPWHSKGVHKMIIGKYIMYYLIIHNISTVRVVAVVYEKQDQKRQLDSIKE